ncbi:MAG: hypothetical protein LBI92_07355 [Azoarcus sp.]|nr:hypothetical protein [Azoarcus sp.]
MARENTAAYGEYVLDLALTGEGNLGGLHVKAGDGCRNAVLDNRIEPVDWVALASLRDDTNSVAAMDEPSDQFAGITTGGDLKKWFSKTGWFPGGIVDTSSWAASQSLDNLLEVNLRSANAYVCLCLNASIIAPTSGEVGMNKIGKAHAPKNWWGGANHWVVLGDAATPGVTDNKDILITLPKQTPQKYNPGPANRDLLLKGTLSFSCYSWGDSIKHVDDRFKPVLTEEFLRYYYGFVIATK